MSAKTKIVVVHMKELILAGIFTALGILFIVIALTMFGSGKNPEAGTERQDASSSVVSRSLYTPGIYTTELILGGNTVAVELIADSNEISSIRLVNLSDSITTMYPLLEPAFASISEQICKNQSLEDVTYTRDSKYTSLVLLEAIRTCLEKAKRAQ